MTTNIDSACRQSVRTAVRASILAITATGAVLGLPSAAVAAERSPPGAVADSDGLESIVVTATKRGEINVQEAPIAIQAISAARLESINAVQIADYVALIPGLSFTDNGPGDKRYAIRGVTASGAGTTSVYLDEVVMTGENAQDGGGQQPDAMLFDVERVEALKGPQGTTFGSSSMTGTIRFITNKPDLLNFAGAARGGLIHTDGGGVGHQADGMINLPLKEGVFAVRLAVFDAINPGFIDTNYQRNANEVRTRAGRASFKWALSDKWTLSGMAMLQRTAADAGQHFNTVGNDSKPLPKSRYYNADRVHTSLDDRGQLYNVTLEDRESYGTFTLTSSRFDRDFLAVRDTTLAISNNIPGLPPDGLGRSAIFQPKDRRITTNEARFASDWQGPVQLLVGVVQNKESRDFRSYVPSADRDGYIEANPRVYLDRTEHVEIDERSAFSNVTWSMTDAWKLTIGGRFFSIDQSTLSSAIVAFDTKNPAGGTPGGGQGPLNKASNDGFIGMANLSYKVTDSLMTYASVSEGYRSGGTNDVTSGVLAGVPIPPGYGSDALTNYELGLKSEWMDRRLQVNGAVYYIDWTDIQVQAYAIGPGGQFPYQGNAGAAGIKGVELELQAKLASNLTMGGFINYNQAKITKSAPNPAQGTAGAYLPQIPALAITFTGDYERPLSDNLMGTAGVQISSRSSRPSSINRAATNYETYPGYTTANVHLGVKKGSTSVVFNVANVFNDDTKLTDGGGSRPVPRTTPIIVRPRTYSLIVGTKF